MIHSCRARASDGRSPARFAVIQKKWQADTTDGSYSGRCVWKRERERKRGGGGQIHRQHGNTQQREQANLASLTCFPKHNLTACPLRLHIPLYEKTKQTGGGVLLTDGKSPRIRSISSLAPTKKTIYPDCTPHTSKHTPSAAEEG